MVSAPLGIKILAILNMLVGLIVMLAAAAPALAGWFLPSWLIAFSAIVFIIGLFNFLVGYGLWTLKTWAWWIDFFFVLIYIALGLSGSNYILLILNVVIFLYLIQGSVRRKFKVG